MRVLVSNDDGVDAPGLRVLARAPCRVGEVTVVAPDRDRSGASNSLTLDAADPRRAPRRRPLQRRRHADRLRAPRAVGPARPRARHRRLRHQQLGQPRRRRDLFRHRLGGDGRTFPRLSGDRDLARQRRSQGHALRKRGRGGAAADAQAARRSAAGRHDPQRQRAGPAVARDQWLRGDAARPPPSLGAVRRADRSARTADLLDRSAGRSRGRRSGHGLPCDPRRHRSRSRRSTSI